jgi:hypothetical protein
MKSATSVFFQSLAFSLTTLTSLLVFSAQAQVPSYVPTNGLINYWPFSGNANDASGNGNNGTVSGATLGIDRNGNSNSCYDFNGQGDFIQCQPLLQLDNSPYMTLSCWFKIEGQNTNLDCVNGCAQYLMSQGLDAATGNSFFGLAYNQSVVPYAFGIANGYSNLFINSLAGSADFSSWNHLVFVFSFGVNKLYLNGSLVATNNYMGVVSSPNLPLFFGKYNGDASFPYYLNGKLDDIGVWNRALTEAEVGDLFIGCAVSATLQPSDISVLSGNDASFTVAGSNANCTFQWQTDLGLGWQNLTNAGQYSGVNTSTLTVLNTNISNNNQNFRCLITLGTCNAASSSAVLTVLPTSISDEDVLSFSLYPNPADAELNLQTTTEFIGTDLFIFDALGKQIHKQQILSTNTTINTSSFSAGNYVVKLGGVVKRFAVKK